MRLVIGETMEKLLKVLTDPISNRILQMIRLRRKMTIYALPLSDKDFSAMMSNTFRIVDKYQKKKATSDAKLRSLYLLSAPGGENNK